MMLDTLERAEMMWLKPRERQSSVYLQDTANGVTKQRKPMSGSARCYVRSSTHACVSLHASARCVSAVDTACKLQEFVWHSSLKWACWSEQVSAQWARTAAT
jgi:hypothetical protein